LYNVYTLLSPPSRRALTTRPAQSSGRLNATPPLEAFGQLLPIAAFCGLCALWVFSPRSAIRDAGRMAELVVVVGAFPPALAISARALADRTITLQRSYMGR